MAQKKSQVEKILKYLASGKKLTASVAKNRFSVERLPARIYDLRELGWTIHTEKQPRGTFYQLESTEQAEAVEVLS